MNQPNTPYIRSRVNGIMIPLHADQVGIMHRFAQPENQLVVSEINSRGGNASSEQGMTLQVPATPDPATAAQTAAAQSAQTAQAAHATAMQAQPTEAPAKAKTSRSKRQVPPVNQTNVPVL